MKLILPGYEGTKNVLTAVSYFVNKYLPDFDVYYPNFGTFNDKLYCGKFISLDDKQHGGKHAWAKYVVKFLESIDDDIIIFADGDFFVTKHYDVEEFNKLLNEVKTTYKVGFMSCGYEKKRLSRIAGYGIWRRDFLLEVLRRGVGTAMQFESRGGGYINHLNIKEKIVTSRRVVRYERGSAYSSGRAVGLISVGESNKEDVEYLIKMGHIPPKEQLVLELPRAGHSIYRWDNPYAISIDTYMRKIDNKINTPTSEYAGEERSNTLRRGLKECEERYVIATENWIKKGSSVVDLGCGICLGTQKLSFAGNKVVSIDKNKKLIEFGKKIYPHYSKKHIVADLDNYIVEGYDVAVCLEVIHHLKNVENFLQNIKVNQLIISSLINIDPNDNYKLWLSNNNILHYWTEEQFKNLFKGWKLVDEFKQKDNLTLYLKK